MLYVDQTPIKSCAFPDGRTHSYDEPLHPVVSESRVFSVCEDGDWTKFAAAGSPQVTIPDRATGHTSSNISAGQSELSQP